MKTVTCGLPDGPKDLIIRGGQNVDPAVIEDALAAHQSVAFVGAVGQTDTALGELPCAYVELVAGASDSAETILEFAQQTIKNRLALPVHVEILNELPKTAVGKVFKPDLRKRATQRVINKRLMKEGLTSKVERIYEDPRRGIVTRIVSEDEANNDRIREVLGEYAIAWELSDRT